jgi:hypothetical protein
VTFGAFQGELRPLVEAAWNNHAGLLGLSTGDKVDRDSWYRDNLWAACRITTTKTASDRQRYQLLSWFAQAAGMPSAPVVQAPRKESATTLIHGWSTAQLAAFWKLAHAAHHAAAQRAGDVMPDTLDGWLLDRLGGAPVGATRAKGKWYLGSSTEGFDTAMSVLAIEAGDLYWIDRTSSASARRLMYQINLFLTDLSWLEGQTVGWSYAVAIYRQRNSQGNLPDTMSDCPAKYLLDVLQALDTHIRRLCAKSKVRPCHCPTRPPSDPDLLQEWRYYHHPTPGHTRKPSGQLIA